MLIALQIHIQLAELWPTTPPPTKCMATPIQNEIQLYISVVPSQY